MQIGGGGFSISTANLMAAIKQSPTLGTFLLRYA
jgi:hypothetical protein